MSQDAVAASEPQFTVGRVFAKSFEVFGRNFITFTLLSFLFTLPTLAVEFFLNPAMSDDIAQVGQGSASGYAFLSNLVSLICTGLVSGALVYGTFQDLRGQKASFGECLSRAMTVLTWVAVGAIIYGLITGLGFILLIIPGLMIMVIYWVYAPAIVVEKLGPIQALSRSAELTKGRRWHVFGLVLAIVAASIIFGAVGGMVLATGGVITMLIGLFVIMGLISAYSAVATTVAYYYLRADKEGLEIDDIAKLFD